VKPGGGNLVLVCAEDAIGVTFEGPSPKPSNNFAHPDTFGGNLKKNKSRYHLLVAMIH
jgi:hypothetical protein